MINIVSNERKFDLLTVCGKGQWSVEKKQKQKNIQDYKSGVWCLE